MTMLSKVSSIRETDASFENTLDDNPSRQQTDIQAGLSIEDAYFIASSLPTFRMSREEDGQKSKSRYKFNLDCTRAILRRYNHNPEDRSNTYF
jgi:hypothetical protein